MKYLKITTIVYKQEDIDAWLMEKISPESANRLRNGEELSINRDGGSTTLYQLLEEEIKK